MFRAQSQLEAVRLKKSSNMSAVESGRLTHQVLVVQCGSVHQSKRDACLSSSEGLRRERRKKNENENEILLLCVGDKTFIKE